MSNEVDDLKSALNKFTDYEVAGFLSGLNLWNIDNGYTTGAVQSNGTIDTNGAWAIYKTAKMQLAPGNYTIYTFNSASVTSTQTLRIVTAIFDPSGIIYDNTASLTSKTITVTNVSEVWVSIDGDYWNYLMVVCGENVITPFKPFLSINDILQKYDAEIAAIDNTIGDVTQLQRDSTESQITLGTATQGGLTGVVGNTISKPSTTNYYYYTIDIADTSAHYKIRVGKGTSSSYPNYIFVCDSTDKVLAVYAHPGATQAWETVEFAVPSNASKIYALSTKELYTGVEATKIEYEDADIVSVINKMNSSVLSGKTLLVFGDSIAFGSGNNVPSAITGSSYTGIGEIVAEKYGMNCIKRAVGGATIAVYTGSTNNIVAQIDYAIQQSYSPDFILMDGYTNDIAKANLVKGTITEGYSSESYDKSTFCGAWEYIISTLKKTYPNAKIVYFLPHNMPTRTIALQEEYTELVKSLCKKWSVEVADIYGRSNMLTWLTQYMQFTNNGEGTPDGTHPNGVGYEKFYLPIIENCIMHI